MCRSVEIMCVSCTSMHHDRVYKTSFLATEGGKKPSTAMARVDHLVVFDSHGP